MNIKSRAPTRIDLAGGTVDLWPLYLFLNRPTTVNLGIDLYAETELTFAPGSGNVILRSEDQNMELKLSWSSLPTLSQVHPAVELHFKLLRHFAEKRERAGRKDHLGQDLVFSTRAKSPAGAGLGGSSALNVTMTGALASWVQGSPVEPAQVGEKLIEICRDIETTVIQVPAGLQDYYGAMYGGLQALRWGAGTHSRERLPDSIMGGIEERLMLFYSGQSRNSGINNWQLFKNFIDNVEATRASFQKISDATTHLESALLAGDWMKAGQAIAEEWATRRTLAPGVSTEKMNQAFAKASQIAPVSGKVCGAGGGGCFFIYNPTPDAAARRKIEEAFVEQGMRPLPYKASQHGLEVKFS